MTHWGLAASALLASLLVARTDAQDLAREGFEGDTPTWRLEGGDASHHVEEHVRERGAAYSGDWCEYLRLSAGNGTSIYISHEVGQARLIDELVPSLRLKSDRPGMQLLARVVLPHSKDPTTGEPISTLIHGTSYQNVGKWQQLRVPNLSKMLLRQSWLLRRRYGPHIDTRQAFVDRLFVNAYGGRGGTQIWLDDLELEGYVAREDEALPAVQPTAWTSAPANAPAISLDGSVFAVDGKPFFPLVVQHRGESLSSLKKLGFNAVWLSAPPPADLLEEASQARIWLVCPPLAQQGGGTESPLEEIGPEYDWVLAWDLGQGLTDAELPRIKELAARVRQSDALRNRPLTCDAESNLRSFSRHVDFLRASRPVLGTSLDLAQWGEWLTQRPRLARPGTIFWETIETGYSAALSEQLALAAGGGQPLFAQDEQIRLQAYTALAAGTRGLCFTTMARLDEADSATMQLGRTLELLNLELTLVAPFAAAGAPAAIVSGASPDVRATLLQTERARLLLPIWNGKNAQFVPGQAAGVEIPFVVPVPESYKTYEITPAGLRTLRHLRKTGGTKITLDEFGLTTAVLLTQDPLVITGLSRRLAQLSRRAAQLERDLAAGKLADAARLDRELAAAGSKVPNAAGWLSVSQRGVSRCDALLAAGDYPAAYLEAHRALRPLRLLQAAHWQQAVALLPSPVSSPLAVSCDTLVRQLQFAARLAAGRPQLNRLPAGDFEDLSRMQNAGWRHYQHQTAGLQATAELALGDSHLGERSLHLAVTADEPQAGDALVESVPLWVTSAAVPVQEGQLLRIHGWARVPSAVTGSVDGLMIFDTLTGQALAERIQSTRGWQEFSLVRWAPRSSEMRLTIALTGFGEAWIDDVTIEPLELPAAPLPQSRATALPRRP